jgi:REP element-mobilizing transposase RayT
MSGTVQMDALAGRGGDEPSKRGGKREGAGRKKSRRNHDAPHRARPELSARHPVHVVLRMVVRVSWRTRDYYRFVQRALQGTLGRGDFRIVHVSIQNNHLHLLVEATDRKALTRGMSSFTIRLARIVHDSVGGVGKVFAFRYHATQIKTARHARHALAYVLNNWRRHNLDYVNGRAVRATLDEYSSALSFDGWARGERFRVPRNYDPLAVSAPKTSLFKFDWQNYGLIQTWEKPGPLY